MATSPKTTRALARVTATLRRGARTSTEVGRSGTRSHRSSIWTGRCVPGRPAACCRAPMGASDTMHRLDASGAPHARVTIRAAPRNSVTVVGYVLLGGAYTTLSHVRIDGSNRLLPDQGAGGRLPPRRLQATRGRGPNDILEYDDYYQSVPLLRGNRHRCRVLGRRRQHDHPLQPIHDVGACLAYDHLIYLSHGNNVRIYDNWMWNDPQRPRHPALPGAHQRPDLGQRHRPRRRRLRHWRRAGRPCPRQRDLRTTS